MCERERQTDRETDRERKKFSEVKALEHLLYTVTIERSFGEFARAYFWRICAVEGAVLLISICGPAIFQHLLLHQIAERRVYHLNINRGCVPR